MIGLVRRWGALGFGFIECAEVSTNVYFNTKHLAEAGYLPRHGDEVEFNAVEVRPGRFEARMVRRTSTIPGALVQLVGAKGASIAISPYPALAAIALTSKPALLTQHIPIPVFPKSPSPIAQSAAELASKEEKPQTVAALSEQLRHGFAHEKQGLEAEQAVRRSRVADAESQVTTTKQAFKEAQGQFENAKWELSDTEGRLADLPASQKTRQDRELVGFIEEARVEFAARLAGRRKLLLEANHVREASITRLGKEVVEKYERVRGRSKAESDSEARDAFVLLEKKERDRVADYAGVLDRLDEVEEVPLRFVHFESKAEDGWQIVVSQIPEETKDLDDFWRVRCAFWEAAERAAKGLAVGEVADIERGVVGGCEAVRVRTQELRDFLFFLIEEAISSRPSLRPLGLAPVVETVAGIDIPISPSDEQSTLVREAVATGGSATGISKRIGLPLRRIVSRLVRHDLPFPDDVIEEGTTNTLLQLLGISVIQPASETSAGDGAVGDADYVSTAEEAVERIEKEHPQRIRIQPIKQSFIKGNPFEHPTRLYRALRFLATTYYDAKTKAVPCPNMDETLRLCSGFSYRPSQSDVTMGEFANHYEMTWKGKRVQLKEHIVKGDSKDARHAMRVAFFFDDKDQVVVIGYIGQHQRTRAT